MKKLVRRIVVAAKQRPYYPQPLIDGQTMAIHYLINQRSHGHSSKQIQSIVCAYLKDQGFFNWYVGKRNARGQKIMVCPVDSLFYYSKQALNRKYGLRIETQPSHQYFPDDYDWGITMFFEGKYYAATVRNGFAYLSTETEQICFELDKNQWCIRSRFPLDDYDDLPF